MEIAEFKGRTSLQAYVEPSDCGVDDDVTNEATSVPKWQTLANHIDCGPEAARDSLFATNSCRDANVHIAIKR